MSNQVENLNKSSSKSPKSSVPKRLFNKLFIESCFIFNHKLSNQIIVFFLLSTTIWLLLYTIFNIKALPGSLFFSIWALITASHILGFIFELIKMPSLLGMLLVGIFSKNIPYISIVSTPIDPETSSILRNIAFSVILCRAGLSLDIAKLKTMKLKILKYAFIPCLVEAIACGVVSKFVLNISFSWAFLMGFVVSGVSPAVVVPLMIQLQEQGLGVLKNIPGVVIAASCIDNIIAITGEMWWALLQCPIQIGLGILFGSIVALFFHVIRIEHRISLEGLRFTVLLAVSVIASIGSKKVNLSTSGPLAVLTLTIVSKIIWHKVDEFKHELNEKVLQNQKNLDQMFSKLWSIVFLPILFSLIGNEVNLSKVKLDSIAIQLGILSVSLLSRLLATFLSVYVDKELNLKEKIFMCIAWIPKATVQAAVGSIAYELAKNPHDKQIGTNILNMAVLSIIATAPLGTLLISLSAKKLLYSDQLNFSSSVL